MTSLHSTTSFINPSGPSGEQSTYLHRLYATADIPKPHVEYQTPPTSSQHKSKTANGLSLAPSSSRKRVDSCACAWSSFSREIQGRPSFPGCFGGGWCLHGHALTPPPTPETERFGNVHAEKEEQEAIFEFGRGFYGNTYISVLSMLTLTPTVRLPNAWLGKELGMKRY